MNSVLDMHADVLSTCDQVVAFSAFCVGVDLSGFKIPWKKETIKAVCGSTNQQGCSTVTQSRFQRLPWMKRLISASNQYQVEAFNAHTCLPSIQCDCYDSM